ncbi:MAG: AAA family ATPase [Planctomycetota bacterium]
MLKKLQIKNFRCFETLTAENFGRVNLILGANNAGKTSFLEGLFLATGGANPTLLHTIEGVRSFPVSTINFDFWAAFFHNFQHEKAMEFVTVTDQFTENVTYRLPSSALQQTIPMPTMGPNSPTLGRDINDSPARTVPQFRTTEITATIDRQKAGTTQTETVNLVRSTGPNGNPYFSPSPQERGLIGPVGVYVSAHTVFLRLGPVAWFENFKKNKQVDPLYVALRTIEPRLVEITVLEGILFCDLGLPKMLPLSSLGAGTEWLLKILANLMSARDGYLFIDEIESGLHHSILGKVWELVYKFAQEYSVQVFATTHSWEAVTALAKLVQERADLAGQTNVYRLERGQDEVKIVEIGAEAFKTAVEMEWEVR